MAGERSGYRAYMLRLWRAGSDEGPVWRALLESAHTGERQVFADLQALFAFLEQEVCEPAETPDKACFRNDS